MRHFVCYPSAERERGVLCAWKWKERGYETCVALDGPPHEWQDSHAFDLIETIDSWQGYYRHIGALAGQCFERGGADLVTCIGDDMDPPTQGADRIAEMYFSRFADGFGVLQGTGDPSGMDETGTPAAARICGSPTFGRGWWKRAYGGKGPFHDGYRSFYADEDLWHVARLSGVLCLEPSITIKHNHWSFGGMARQPYHERAEKNWKDDQSLFLQRKADSFPGHEPLAVTP